MRSNRPKIQEID